MNAKILEILNNKEEFYPHQLEQKFPHILDRLIIMWDSPEFDSYLNKFMLDTRAHARQGFPPEVASEILHLSRLHGEQFGIPANGTNSWIDSSNMKIE